MKRRFYRLLLWMHPPGFRDQFADEMLWIYDEAASGNGNRAFFRDALGSLARQWLIRRRAWTVVLAALAAASQAALLTPMVRFPSHKIAGANAPLAVSQADQHLAVLIFAAASGVVLMVGIAAMRVFVLLRPQADLRFKPAGLYRSPRVG